MSENASPVVVDQLLNAALLVISQLECDSVGELVYDANRPKSRNAPFAQVRRIDIRDVHLVLLFANLSRERVQVVHTAAQHRLCFFGKRHASDGVAQLRKPIQSHSNVDFAAHPVALNHHAVKPLQRRRRY